MRVPGGLTPLAPIQKARKDLAFRASCSDAVVTPHLAHIDKDRPRARPARVRRKEESYFFFATFLAGAFFLAAFFLAFLAGAFLAAAFFFAAMVVLVFVFV